MTFTLTVDGRMVRFECEAHDGGVVQRLLAAALGSGQSANGRSSTTAVTQEGTTPLLARAAAGERAGRKPAIRIKKRKYTKRRVALTASTTCAFCANSFVGRVGQKFCSPSCQKKAARLSQRRNGGEPLPELPDVREL
jgi:hypothetical protein